MTSLEFETEEMRPVKAWCMQEEVHVTLADGRTMSTPLWWSQVDEGISVKSKFLGTKAPEMAA